MTGCLHALRRVLHIQNCLHRSLLVAKSCRVKAPRHLDLPIIRLNLDWRKAMGSLWLCRNDFTRLVRILSASHAAFLISRSETPVVIRRTCFLWIQPSLKSSRNRLGLLQDSYSSTLIDCVMKLVQSIVNWAKSRQMALEQGSQQYYEASV